MPLLLLLADVGAGRAQQQQDGFQHGHEAAMAEALRNPLSPPLTGSPRETLLGFMTAIRAAYDVADAPEAETRTLTALRRAVRALDLSQQSAQLTEHRGVELALMLKEVFDRIPMPPLADAPDAAAVSAAQRGASVADIVAGIAAGADPRVVAPPAEGDLNRWVLPGTEIDIVRMEDGPKRGQYLFSTHTVARVEEYYDRVRDLPYRAALAGEDSDGEALPDYVARNVTPGVLTAYVATPGEGLALGWGRTLPAWSTMMVLGQTVWQWMATALVVSATAALTLLSLRWAMAREAALRGADDADGGVAAPPRRWRLLAALGASVIAISCAQFAIVEVINVSGDTLIAILDAMILLRYALFAWFTALLIGQAARLVIAARRLPHNAPDSHLIRFAGRFLSLVAVVVVIVLAAQRIGLPVYSVVTGLGIGGLAVAFAAQQSLGAMFGSIMIMMDRPFRVGDHIVMDGVEGVVEDIGFRSTRIRTMHDSVLTVPNSQMASATVDNLGLRTWRRVRAEFEIRDDTPAATVQAFLDRIRAIIAGTPTARQDRCDVVVSGFGAAGLLILIEFFLKAPDRSARRRVQQDMFMQLLAAADELGVRFAPNQALEIAMTGAPTFRPGQRDGGQGRAEGAEATPRRSRVG